MAERRLALILEWFERHPERYDAVKKKLLGLNLQFAKVQKSLKPLVKTSAEEEKMTEAVSRAKAKEALQFMNKEKNLKRVSASLGEYVKGLQKTENWMDRWSKKLLKAGWRIGFFGWIVSYGARSVLKIFQQLVKVFSDLVKVSVEWPSSLEKVYTALALLESQGLLTSQMETSLEATADRLLEQGPAFEALWTGLEATFISFATVITSKLIPYLQELLQWLTAYLAREDVQQLLARLGISMFQLIRALVSAIPALVAVLNALSGWMPIIAFLVKTIAPFIPLVFVLGTAIWMLGPILTVAGFALKIFGFLVSGNIVSTLAYSKVTWILIAAMQNLKITLLGVAAVLALIIGYFVVTKKWTFDWKKWFQAIQDTTKKAMAGVFQSISGGMEGSFAVTEEQLGEINDAMEENFENMQFVSEDAFFNMAMAANGFSDSVGDVQSTVSGLDLTIDTSGFETAMDEMNASIGNANNNLLLLTGAFSALQIGAILLAPVLAPHLTAAFGAVAGAVLTASGPLLAIAPIVTGLVWTFIMLQKSEEDQIAALNEIGNAMTNTIDKFDTGRLALMEQSRAFLEASKSAGEYKGALDDLFKHSPLPDLITWVGRSSEAVHGLSAEMGRAGLEMRKLAAPEMGLSGGPQYITISAPISIGNVTAEVDMNEIQNRVAKGLAEALRSAR